MPPLLLLQDIALTLGVAPLLSGAGLAVATGDRICLVGRNGSGKSILLRIAAGLVQADAGERFAQPGTTIQYLPQEPDLAGFATTLAYVEAGFDAAAAEGRHRALYLLKELGLEGNEDPASLSGGEARRAALARALAPSPDILLLDEPTNHLDLPGIEWLERELAELRSGIVLISHDRRLLERFSHRTVWLDRGITRLLEQGFASFEGWRDAILEQEESEQHKLGRKITMEEDWLRYSVTARRTRNQQRLAELHALRRKRREHTTIAEHMPSSHRRYAQWTIERIGREAAAIADRLISCGRADDLVGDDRPIRIGPAAGHIGVIVVLGVIRQRQEFPLLRHREIRQKRPSTKRPRPGTSKSARNNSRKPASFWSGPATSSGGYGADYRRRRSSTGSGH